MITGESVKFIGSLFKRAYKYYKYELTHLNKWIHTSYLSRSVQHLKFKVKIQNNLNKQITTIAESSVPWSDLTFP